MLRKIVTSVLVAQALNALETIETPIMDEFYPQKIRRNHPFASIDIHEISRIIKAVPVVMRGTEPINIGEGAGSINSITPQPIDVIETISGAVLNDLKIMDGTSQNMWLQDRMDFARQTIRATTEALCIQSLSGKIAFAMKTDTGIETYEIKFGNVLIFVPQKNLSAADADIGTLLNIMRDMKSKIKRMGGGTKVKYKVSPDVFDKIVAMVTGVTDNTIKIEIQQDKVFVAGWEISVMDDEYYDPKTKSYKRGIADGTMKAIATNGGFGFRYLALDDIDAGLKAVPLFAKAIKRDIPSGWIINTMSKPLPIASPKSICDAVVI